MGQISKLVAAVAVACVAQAAFAAPITGTGAPASNAALAGATVINFDAPLATTTSATYGALTITSGSAATFYADSAFPGQYNTTGGSLQNSESGTRVFNFAFDSLVSAFGFNFGASDNAWTLEAFDSNGDLLDSTSISAVFADNSGSYFGLSVAGIASARLFQADTAATDWILLDNFSYVAGDVPPAEVPEPASLALVGLGLAGLAAARRRKQA